MSGILNVSRVRRRLVCSALMACFAAVGAGVEAAEADRLPRTAWGAPDLEGVWTNSSSTFLQRRPTFKTLVISEAEAVAFEASSAKRRAAVFADVDPAAAAPEPVEAVANADIPESDTRLGRVAGQVRTSWIVEPADGRLPLSAAGRARIEAFEKMIEKTDGPEVRPTAERCLTAVGSADGPPMLNTLFNPNYQIIQTPDHLAIVVEMNHDVRIVRLRSRAHAPPAVRPWMGDSVGWWEGDTLVVETTNMHPQGTEIWSPGGGFVTGPKAVVKERFTRKSKDLILYEFTVEDPDTFTGPWRAEMPFRAAAAPLFEYACHEGNYSLANVLAGARAAEGRVVGSAP
jgi:hypothetical protein